MQRFATLTSNYNKIHKIVHCYLKQMRYNIYILRFLDMLSFLLFIMPFGVGAGLSLGMKLGCSEGSGLVGPLRKEKPLQPGAGLTMQSEEVSQTVLSQGVTITSAKCK